MAKLTTQERNSLPSSEFAGPDRSYPIENASHAQNALARVSQAENSGRIGDNLAAHIRARAKAKLGNKPLP